VACWVGGSAPQLSGQPSQLSGQPYGEVSAAPPDTVPPGGAKPKRRNWALRERAEDHHAVGVAGGDCGRRIAHRGRAAAAAPLHVREAQFGQAERGGESRGVVAIVAVGGKPSTCRGSMPASSQADRMARRARARTGTPARDRACSTSSRRPRRSRPGPGCFAHRGGHYMRVHSVHRPVVAEVKARMLEGVPR
jgi:hypothetical protein